MYYRTIIRCEDGDSWCTSRTNHFTNEAEFVLCIILPDNQQEGQLITANRRLLFSFSQNKKLGNVGPNWLVRTEVIGGNRVAIGVPAVAWI